MKINTQVRYGMRAVIKLWDTYLGESKTIIQMAEEENISVKYLENIFVKLKAAGIVISQRGKNGGYNLARNPNEITAYDVFMAFDESVNLVHCIDDPEKCDRKAQCKSQNLWKELSEIMIEKLKTVSIKELANK